MGALNRGASIAAPEHLDAAHDVASLDSGAPALDEWLRRRALKNEEARASRTYVVTAEQRVVGYYALATGAVALAAAPGRVRRNMPDPVPIMVLARLAVDRRFQRRGIAGGLLRDATLRTLAAAEIAGIRALLVHALSDEAKRFYELHGFVESPLSPLTLMISLADAERALAMGGRSR